MLFLVVSALVYMVAHMDTVGEMILDILFEQFYFELVLDTVLDSKRGFYKARGARLQSRAAAFANPQHMKTEMTSINRERSNSFEKVKKHQQVKVKAVTS